MHQISINLYIGSRLLHIDEIIKGTMPQLQRSTTMLVSLMITLLAMASPTTTLSYSETPSSVDACGNTCAPSQHCQLEGSPATCQECVDACPHGFLTCNIPECKGTCIYLLKVSSQNEKNLYSRFESFGMNINFL